MKVMIVLDDDGHCSVFAFNLHNLKKCLEYLIENGHNEEEELRQVLKKEDVTAEEIEAALEEHVICRCGQVYIEEVDDWE